MDGLPWRRSSVGGAEENGTVRRQAHEHRLRNGYLRGAPCFQELPCRRTSGELSLRPTPCGNTSASRRPRRICPFSSRRPSRRTEPLDHVLLHGPPGLGKTTLAASLPPRWG
ncbi:MAG: hypothetical protein ACLR5H_08105 [Oscillospiraceae bacterium]